MNDSQMNTWFAQVTDELNDLRKRPTTPTLPRSIATHTIVLAKITGGGTNGSITWNDQGLITAFVDPT